ncbi:MAG: SulP family inorganic anion transporter [Chlamydiota bacterium]
MPVFSDLQSYSFAHLRKDLLAGLSIACLVIPQAIAYALLAGLPLSSGIYSAIFGAFLVALFSHARGLISGPSTAIAMLVQTVVTSIAIQEIQGDLIEVLAHLLALVGLLHLLLSLCNISKCLQFVSRSVMLGYFSGLSMVICVEQLFHFFALKKPEGSQVLIHKILYLIGHGSSISYLPILFGTIGLGFLFVVRKKAPAFPAALFLLVGSSLTFSFFPQIESLPTLSRYAPLTFSVDLYFPRFRLDLLQQLFPLGLAIAFLGVLEVFSVAKALSITTKEPVRCNQEVFSLGVANLFLSLFPCAMPTSASITRSLLAQNMGIKTRIGALSSSVFVYGLLVFFWSYVAYIPVVSLSSLLIFSAFRIIDCKAIKLCLRATKEDAFIFLFTFFLCMIFRLDIAFIIGVLFSIGFYLRSAATPHFQEYAFDYAGRLSIIRPNTKKHSKVRIIGIGGELFFGMVDVLEGVIANIARDQDVKVVVLRLNNVHYVDGSMCLAIVQLHEHLQSTGRVLMISGLTEKVWRTLSRAKVLEKMQPAHFFLRDETRPQLSTWKACLRAEEILSDQEQRFSVSVDEHL